MTTVTKSKRLPPFKPYLRQGVREGWKLCTRRLNGLDSINEDPGAWYMSRYDADYGRLTGRWIFRPSQICLPAPGISVCCPYGVVGDRVHLIEPLELHYSGGYQYARYRDDGAIVVSHDVPGGVLPWRWSKPYLTSIHMPTEAARWFGRITEIRVERVQEITEKDAIAEGVTGNDDPDYIRRSDSWRKVRNAPIPYPGKAYNAFCYLWERIHGAGSWTANPHVWVIRWEPEQ